MGWNKCNEMANLLHCSMKQNYTTLSPYDK